ncbi:MAG: hypothetical protein ACYTHM_22875 [Planctomycetota bacterium]|jgi:hypothetical protein
MLAVFSVGNEEVHRIEVFSSYWTGRDIVKVDGEVVVDKKKSPVWFSEHIHFEVGEKEKHRIDLHFNAITLRSQAYVDDALHVGCLFPQVPGYQAMMIAIIALAIATAAFMAA